MKITKILSLGILFLASSSVAFASAPDLGADSTTNKDENLALHNNILGVCDANSNTDLTFTITAGNTNNDFIIVPGVNPNENCGYLQLDHSLDFETTPTYTLTVHAENGDGADNKDILFNVGDVNEAPNIPNSHAATPVPENASNGDSAYTNVNDFTTGNDTDEDGDAITYSITGGNADNIFAIDPATGVITVGDNTNLNYESTASYTLTVEGTDGTLSDTGSFTIDIGDVNDDPEFLIPNVTKLVDENINTSFSTISATDEDVADVLTYSISAGDDIAKFTINSATGDLTFVSSPNFEDPGDLDTDNHYEITVTVDDGNGGTDTLVTTVVVADVDEGPHGAIGTPLAQDENVAIGTAFYNIDSFGTTTHDDTDEDGDAITYTVVSGNTNDDFAVDPATGVVTSAKDLDFETTPTYTLIVEGASTGTSGVPITANFTVNLSLNDINDPSAVDDGFNVGEDSVDNVFDVILNDDFGPDGPSGAMDLQFTAASHGTVVLNNGGTINDQADDTLEYTPTGGYAGPDSFTYTIEDIDGDTATATVNITVSDVNSAPEITSNGGGVTAAITIDENITAVTTLTATDPNAGDTISYRSIGGADQLFFDIDPVTGVVEFNITPNFEDPRDANGDNVYEVNLSVIDGEPLEDTQLLSVTIGDVAENVVIMSNGAGNSATIHVDENTTAVTTVVASLDAGETADYHFDGAMADEAAFTLDAATGVLTFVTAPDFENPADDNTDNIYTVTLEVTDGTTMDMQDLTIIIDDVNESSGHSGRRSSHNDDEPTYVCKDSRATNFSSTGTHKESLCEYTKKEKKNGIDFKMISDILKTMGYADKNGDGIVDILESLVKQQETSCSVITTGIYRVGSRGEAVRQIQQYLKDNGYLTGTVDGIFGNQTAAAVRKMQTKLGLIIDGIIGSQSIGIMNTCSK